MSKVKIQGNASGTGVVTLTAPNTNTDRTITLPDGDITLGVGIDDNADATAITIDANENVGIGTSSPANRLSVKSPDNTLATNIAQFDSLNGAAGFKFGYQRIEQIGATVPITFETGGSESMRIQSGGGISFNGDTAAANALDDYEEGTWTPTPAQGITGGLSIDSARYTKIGRTVTWSMYISSFTGNTSDFRIGGLPFTNQGSNGYSMQSNINCSANNATLTNPHFRIPPSSSTLYALKNNDTYVIGTELDYSHLIASGTYQTD